MSSNSKSTLKQKSFIIDSKVDGETPVPPEPMKNAQQKPQVTVTIAQDAQGTGDPDPFAKDGPTPAPTPRNRTVSSTTLFKQQLAALKNMTTGHPIKSFKYFIKLAPLRIRNLFIETLLIPASRSEWDKYSRWDPNLSSLNTNRDRSEGRAKKQEWIRQRKREHDLRILVQHFRMQQQEEGGLYQDSSLTTGTSGHGPVTGPGPAIKSISALSNLSRRKTLKSLRVEHELSESHNHGDCQRIKINVSGKIFETQLRTVQKYPLSLLGDPSRRLPFFDPATATYYFDRHRESFEMILYFYQSGGRVRRPYNVNIEIFLSEIVFFDLGDAAILEFRKNEGLFKDDEERILPKNLFQRKVWLLFEYPESSLQSTIVAIVSIIAILISITSFCMETLPMFSLAPNVYRLPNGKLTTQTDTEGELLEDSDFSEVFNFIEFNCVMWFALEFVMRLLSCPKKLSFCLSGMNIIDLVAILPYFFQLVSTIQAQSNPKKMSDGKKKNGTYLAVLRVIRLVRVFRIFKLSRHSRGLQILGLTLQASVRELGLLMFFLLISVILFASAVFTAESGSVNTKFTSIPHSFYWGIITMTTVGYGDMTPVTFAGKIIGGFCAIAGVLTIALPVPVIVSNFNFFYLQGTEEKTVESMYNHHHVPMCSFLPGNGIHPDADGSSGSDEGRSGITSGGSGGGSRDGDGSYRRGGGGAEGDGYRSRSKRRSRGKRNSKSSKSTKSMNQKKWSFTGTTDTTLTTLTQTTDADSFEDLKYAKRMH